MTVPVVTVDVDEDPGVADACTTVDELSVVVDDGVVDVLAGACEPPQAASASARVSAASFILPFYSAAQLREEFVGRFAHRFGEQAKFTKARR